MFRLFWLYLQKFQKIKTENRTILSIILYYTIIIIIISILLV